MQCGDTALHTAARYGHAGVASILIHARTSVNVQNTVSENKIKISKINVDL